MGDYVYLYHEKQVAGLCAVHALNTLFQEPLFSPVDLMHIAQEFDAKEREQMMQAGVDSPDFLKYMAVCTFFLSAQRYPTHIVSYFKMTGR